MRNFPLFFLASALVSVGAATAGHASTSDSTTVLVDRERRRLEELFIWKMAEELKLPVETEAPFAEAIRSLNREKVKANGEVAQALEALEKAKSKAETDRAVKQYEKAWKSYGELPIREVSRIRSLLGGEKLGRYLIAKSQMAEKLKALSATSDTEQSR